MSCHQHGQGWKYHMIHTGHCTSLVCGTMLIGQKLLNIYIWRKFEIGCGYGGAWTDLTLLALAKGSGLRLMTAKAHAWIWVFKNNTRSNSLSSASLLLHWITKLINKCLRFSNRVSFVVFFIYFFKITCLRCYISSSTSSACVLVLAQIELDFRNDI